MLLNHQQNASTSARKILIVDDNANLRCSFRNILELHDFEVDTACNGQEALEYLCSHDTPALVLLDLMMPVMSGRQLLDRIYQDERFKHIPIVVLSSIADLASPHLHGYPVVAKPVEMEILVQLGKQYCVESPAESVPEFADVADR